MEQRQIFNVTEINKGVYRVKTQYNSYLIYADEVKGKGVYVKSICDAAHEQIMSIALGLAV